MSRADASALYLWLPALISLGLGVHLCVSHPLAPYSATIVFLCLFALLSRLPGAGVVFLPAVLPVLSLAPWTGWRVVDEFDLCVLAVIAAGYWRAARSRQAGALQVLMPLTALAALAAGFLWPGAGGYAGDAPLHDGLRVARSVLWTLLLLPLVRAHARSAAPQRASARFFAACAVGALAVSVAVLWERALFPGWFDFSTPYRTVALFWEMHQGGAALDAYLVLLAPLVVWAWRTMRTMRTKAASGCRAAVALFVLAFAYAVLTSFSRGVWGATLGGLFVLAALSWWRRRDGAGVAVAPCTLADVALVLAVSLEVVLVLGTGAFMEQRLANSENDLRGRWRHWRSGLGVLQAPQDWLFGVGPGQLPRRWLATPDAPRHSGALQWQRDGVLLSGPDARDAAAVRGAYYLTQRVPVPAGPPYRLRLEARSERTAEVAAQLCVQHLLYPAACRRIVLRVEAGDWRRIDALLGRPPGDGCAWLCAGRGVFMLAVRTPQATVEMRQASLVAADGEVLRNPRFADGLAFWYPLASANFRPWHIDNLYLEVLIETGLVGLLLFIALLIVVLRRLWRGYLGGDPLAAYYLASISALLALGLVVSVFDMPRAAMLFGLFLAYAWFDSLPAARAADDPACAGLTRGGEAGDDGEVRARGECRWTARARRAAP
jgi:hypothetical protein